MKKIIALALTLVMVLALVPVFTYAAPEGTGIDSLDKITDLAGTYYLTKDITVETTLAGEFTGKFDGNGKTVTAKVAMFASVNGATVQNFKVKGEITDPANTYKIKEADAYAFYSAVAIVAAGKTTFKDITSDVKFTDTVGVRYGAIAAYSPADYDLTFTNCVNNGAVTCAQYCGGVYGWTDKNGKGVFENCVNNGAVTSSNGYIGGLFCRLGGSDATLTVKNSKNTGAVTTTGSYAGGIMGYANFAPVFENCTNTGAVTAKTDAAGIAGSIGHSVKMVNCVNTGDITGGSSVGGMLGPNNMEKASAGEWLMEGCVNTGKITSTGGAASAMVANISKKPKVATVYTFNYCVNTGDVTGTKQVGALIGYAYGNGTNSYGKANACINTGTITGGTYASQAFAYTNSPATTVENCVMAGKVVAGVEGCKLAVISFSNADFTQNVFKNNYILGDGGYTAFSFTATQGSEAYNLTMDKAPADALVAATEAQLASGEIAFALNTAIGKNVFRQTVGEDKVPTLDADAKEVIKNTDGTYGNPKPVTPTPTGDIAASVAVVALVALFGAAYVSKKVR